MYAWLWLSDDSDGVSHFLSHPRGNPTDPDTVDDWKATVVEREEIWFVCCYFNTKHTDSSVHHSLCRFLLSIEAPGACSWLLDTDAGRRSHSWVSPGLLPRSFVLRGVSPM